MIDRSDAEQTSSRAESGTLSSGFPGIDRILGGGFRRGDVIALGGDVGSGKSALALGIALRAAQRGRRALFASSEMNPARIVERIRAIEERTSIDELRALDAPESTEYAGGATAARPEAALLLPGLGTDVLLEMLRTRGGHDLAVVDNVDSLAAGHAPLDEEVGAAMRQLKAAALEHDIVVLALTHCAGPDERGTAGRPVLPGFGGRGVVVRVSDVVLGLFREELYDSGGGIEGAAELHVLKNRHGGLGYADLYFHKRWLRFEDMVEP